MAISFDSLAKAADYFGGVISPQRLGQLADAQQLRTQEVASGNGGPPRRRVFHEDIAVHLERGDRLDAHDCPCWRVAYTQGVQLVDVGEHPRVVELQELLDLERAEWAKERKQLLAARRLVSRDVEALQQTITQLQDKAAKVSGLEELRSQDASKMETQRGDLEDLQKRLTLLDKQHRETIGELDLVDEIDERLSGYSSRYDSKDLRRWYRRLCAVDDDAITPSSFERSRVRFLQNKVLEAIAGREPHRPVRLDGLQPVEDAVLITSKVEGLRRFVGRKVRPILVDEKGFVLDGKHRVAAALLDGHTEIDAVTVYGLNRRR